MPNYEDLEKMLCAEEDISDTFKEFLLEHIKELEEKTNMSPKEIKSYIERIMLV